ncbi:Prefoldin subunit 4 [Histomonas meleagridis]|uniref:Prefoldin subunit 4 n=1 Tax=Histomonas meleagridis TaxID=135588 RepID=UPI00355A6597|nr:Prefoldin subunit 4 [Histomonas meleagridis]KAH0803816.1 Prefoldin subunit 4 [Histomonas meleagridis]
MAQIEVLAADQEKINRFGNLNSQCIALKMELEALEKKKESYQNSNDDLEEAQMMETFDKAPYQVGNAFVVLPIDTAIEEIEHDKGLIEQKIAQIKGQIDERESEMSTLRTALYAKFGRENINLG